MYRPHPEAERRIKSATLMIKHILAGRSPDVLDAHIRELLDKMIWKITEADGKNDTRYQSEVALSKPNGIRLQHGHVYQKKNMIDLLLRAKADEIDKILALACGCCVTEQEHVRLSQFNSDYGWERYRKAGIIVIDGFTGKRLFEKEC
jgi:hypothetical protein